MEFFYIVCPIVGARKRICRYLTVSILLIYIYASMFECTEIVGSIYEGVVGPSYKKLPGKMPPMLVISGIR